MRVERSYNPLALHHDTLIRETADGFSINAIVEDLGLVFTRPFVALVNGVAVSRADWDLPVPAGATVHFLELPRGGDSNPLAIILQVALLAASIFVPPLLSLTGWAGAVVSAAIMIGGSFLINALFPSETSGTKKADTIYSLTASSNQLRIGQPFAEHFGRFVCYPDLVQGSYTRIEDNEHYLYFLGIIGVGQYEVEGVYIDKTPILDYTGTEYNILPPGTDPALVPRLVWTSAEVSGQELSTEWLTVAVTAAGSYCYHIEFDVVFTSGLISYNDEGEERYQSVPVLAEARLIDAQGAALGEWTTLYSHTYTACSIDPLRYSVKRPGPQGLGRYGFRIRRTSEPSEESKVIDSVYVGGLRGYGGEHPDYGDVTLIEARIKATDQLTGDVASKINVVATRKLYPVGSTGFGTTQIATRSIVDACAYIVTTSNGGRQPESVLDFAALAALEDDLDAAGYYFDHRFTDRTSVMDACGVAAKCGRAVPCMPGGLFALIQDRPQSVPAQVYTEDDYDPDTLTLSHAMRTEDSPTCVEVQYVNADTWEQESVICMDEAGSEENPEVVNLEGCTDRQHAFEIGMYLYWDDRLNRTSVQWQTGLKGHIPQLGQRLMVSAGMCDWGQTGRIAAVDGSCLWLSEPVDFKGETEGKLYITAPDGTASGPYLVLPTAYSHCVEAAVSEVRTQQSHDLRASRYIFGPASQELLAVRCLTVQPQGPNSVRIIGSIIDDSVFDDPGTAPEVGAPAGIPALLDSIALSYLGGGSFFLTWTGSAEEVRIELSEDGGAYSVLEDNYSDHNLAVESVAQTVTVRVTPYDEEEVLQSGLAMLEAYEVIPPPTDLALVGTPGETVTISWNAVSGAQGYEVDLWADGVNRGGKTVTAASASVTVAEMTAIGGPWPVFEVRVATIKNARRSEDQATLEISIPPLAAPTGLSLQAILASGVSISWNAVSGATGYKVYLGTTDDFDPAAAGALVHSGTSLAATIGGLDMTAPYAYYFKVAATNSYYHDVGDLVFSAQLAVTAT